MMSIAAAVVTLAANGFLVRHEVAVAAPPAKVYEALAGKVGSWWSSKHTYSGDAANLSIDARAGGCFCEKLKDGGSVEHMRVVSGALGPLQAHGLAGSLTWRLVPAGDATTLSVTYSVGGFMDGGFEKIAPAVDGVLGDQVQRLKSYAEGK